MTTYHPDQKAKPRGWLSAVYQWIARFVMRSDQRGATVNDPTLKQVEEEHYKIGKQYHITPQGIETRVVGVRGGSDLRFPDIDPRSPGD